MTTVSTKPRSVESVWEWCCDAFIAQGRKLSFPKSTPKEKTYQWRYVTRLAARLDEWEFDDEAAKFFIGFSVEYAAKRKLLHKGLSAFFQSNMLQVCYDKLDEACQSNRRKLAGLLESKRTLDRRGRGKPYLETLLAKDPYGRCQIVNWFENGDITELFLSLSKSCTQALARLDSGQRELLPAKGSLLSLRFGIEENLDLAKKAALILGSDWRKVCLR